MHSVLYPAHTKGTRIRVIGRSKHCGKYGAISLDPSSNFQLTFRVKLDDGTLGTFRGDSLQIADKQ